MLSTTLSSLLLAAASCWWLPAARGAVTVYGPTGVVGGSATSSAASTSTAAPSAPTLSFVPPAFNTVTLQAPPIPSPAPPTQFPVAVQQSAQSVMGLSIPQKGSFYGFSIEMSVANQVVGLNSTYLQVPFLNLMAIMAARGGEVHIRVGGNTQETAVVVDSLPDGSIMQKDKENSSNPTLTPTVYISPEFLYMFANVSALVNAKWYLGIPFNDTAHPRLEIVELGEKIIGSNLLGFQLGNEPDLYVSHKHRVNYDPPTYADEFGAMIQTIEADTNIPVNNNLIGPSVSGTWTPEQVWDTGYIQRFSANLGALCVEHYPENNCAAAFPNANFGPPKDPQTEFPNFLSHDHPGSGPVSIVQPYLNSTGLAQGAQKPFLMFETNTASCGGFPGISDSFGATLWAADYGLQMAAGNFSGALLHVGGIDDTYNPFNPPIRNQSAIDQWSIGSIFYSAVVVAETFGKSGDAQIIDLWANSGNSYTPGYAIYDGGVLSRVALFNYVTDPSGGAAYTAGVTVQGGTVPASVSVKYLLAPSVGEKWNITWAGQSFGGMYQSDGRLKGTESIQTVQCDQTANVCSIRVPAPGFALVFMTSDALSASSPASTVTYATTAVTTRIHTHPGESTVVAPSVLATANGQSGADRVHMGSTSKGSANGAVAGRVGPGVAGLVTLLAGVCVLMGVLRR